jgi:DNA invertase Pin-like site-specific DNA recombinase
MRARGPLAGYIRVSRVGGRDRTDGFISPQVQEDAIGEWAQRSGVEVVIHEPELNVSGGTMNRPVFNAILRAIAAGERGGIVVYRIDRFARSVLGALNTLAELGEHQAAFASTSEDISYVKPQERAFLQMQFVFAEYARATITESWSVATASAVRRGIHVANSVPFGYDRDPSTRRFAPNEFAPLVRELFQLRGDRWGWHRLASLLDERAPLEGGQRWGVSKVQRMLSNRVYLGEARYGQHVNPDAHEPLITPADFDRAQDAKGVMLARRPNKEPLVLAGLIRCASCRYLLKEGRAGSGERRARTYRCNSRAVQGRCPSPQHVMGERIEAYVAEQFKAHLRQVTGRAQPSSQELTAARVELDELAGELAAFTRDLGVARRLRAVGQYDQALEARLQPVERARARLDQLTRDTLGDELAELAEWEFNVDAWWEGASVEARKTALASAIDTIFLRGPGKGQLPGRVLILWRGEGPDDLPRRGRYNGMLRPFIWSCGSAE